MFQVLMMGTMLVLLASLSAGQKKPKLPFPVPLNHFFLVLDAATYRAIESSEFMRQQFAASRLASG